MEFKKKYNKLFLFLFINIFLFSFISAEFGYNNPTLPKLIPPPSEVQINQNITNINQTIINNINQFDQSLNTTDSVQFNNLTLTGNLTLGQKITFAFGEIIDNIVDGFIRITGNLNVTGTLNVSENGTFQSDLIVNGTIFSSSPVKISGGLNVSGDVTHDTNTFHLDSNNNRIGIGTTNPNALLDIFINGEALRLSRSTTNRLEFHTAAGSPFTSKIKVDGVTTIQFDHTKDGEVYFTGGNIGIGTDSPTALLHISGNAPNLFIDATGGTTSSLRFRDGTTQSWRISRFPGNDDLRIVADVADLNVMTFRTSGNVGIGTIDPSALLDVDAGTGRGIIEVDGSTGGCLKIRDTDDAGFTYITTLNGVMTASTTAC